MWITLAVAAIGVGIQLFQNNSVKKAGSKALLQVQAETELGVLKADAAYLGALAQSADALDEANVKSTQIEANRQKLRTVAIVAGIALLSLVIITIAVKNRRS